MGLLKRLFGIGTTPKAEPPTPQANIPLERPKAVAPPRARTTRRSAPQQPHRVAAPSSWIPAGHATVVQGFDLLDGMLYLGNSPSHPSLIDPTLPIDINTADVRGEHLDYWPSYGSIPPPTRTAYLEWLASGRRRPGTNIGFVFLYFYGLERRVLVDIANDGSLNGELDGIRAEVAALLEMYGASSSSFTGYATDFLELIDFCRLLGNPVLPMPAPALVADRRPASALLRAEIGRIVASQRPIPADRALAWAWYLPDNQPRTPAIRCTREFVRLFMLRYDERFPQGLPVRVAKAHVAVEYHAASEGLGTARLTHPSIPDSYSLAAPGRQLKRLFDEVTNELDAYSRWIGRNPDKEGTLPAAAMLPRDLLPAATGSVRKLSRWATTTLGSQSLATTSASELVTLWSSGSGSKLSKADTSQLVQLLDHLNIGIEPDIRFGGPALDPDQTIVLFAITAVAPAIASPEYAAAANLVHLAVAVSKADGDVSGREIDRLMTHMEHALHLSDAEITRLHAHVRWLSTSDPGLNGIRKRFESVSLMDRTRIGKLLVDVATADGDISPEEVRMLTRIYGLLGLDASAVTSQLHGSITSAPPLTRGPVVVRPAGTPEAGAPIPPRPQPASTPSFVLDAEQIRAKLADTAAVSALLSGIFIDDAPSPAAEPATLPAPPPTSDVLPRIGELDEAHSNLFHAIAAREQIPRVEFEQLASGLALMPSGAIDTLNEAAYDICGEPLLEGDNPLIINTYAREEMTP